MISLLYILAIFKLPRDHTYRGYKNNSKLSDYHSYFYKVQFV